MYDCLIEELQKRVPKTPHGRLIDAALTLRPVVHSFWGYNFGDNIPYCDHCGMPQDIPSDFCQSCGADMRQEPPKEASK